VILYFLRHGKAGSPRPKDDDARELTAKGRTALRAAAPVWRRLNLNPEVAISSPLPRALQTAELFCEAMGGTPVTDDGLRPGATWARMARAMGAHSGARRVMFVGHEPDLSTAMVELTGAASIRLRKGGLGCLEFADEPGPAAGELAWLLDPDLYTDDDEED
jgi:phosphohistidine phosphatase